MCVVRLRYEQFAPKLSGMYVLVGCLTFLTSNYYNPSIHNMCEPGAVCPCQKIIRPLWQPRKLSAKVRALMSSNKRQLQAGDNKTKVFQDPVTSVLMVNVKFHSFIKVLLLNESESPRQTTETTNARIGTQFSKSEIKVEWYVIMFPKPFFSERIQSRVAIHVCIQSPPRARTLM